MKFISILLLAITVQLSAKGFSQTISISLKNATLEKAFKEIERQSLFRFVFSSEAIAFAKPVTIELKNASLEKVLGVCFFNQPLSYVIEDRYIVVQKKKEPSIDQGQTVSLIDVKGRASNEAGESVAGATVSVKGTDKRTATDDNCEFLLKEIDENAVLIFSGTNVETFELAIHGMRNIVVNLKTKINKLDELHVIAYGVTTRRYNVGSVSKITVEEISRQPVSNLLSALEGSIPGLLVTQSNGLPGSSFNIQIRGQNTIRKNTNTSIPLDNPLFIIDGVPFAPQNANINQYTSLGAASTTNVANPAEGMSPFNILNPSDIESVEVLRDADATAIYGSRGANGVVLITTKRAKSGKTSVNANYSTGWSHVTRTMEMMNTQQYVQMRREAFKNDNIIATLANAPDLLAFDTSRFIDWKHYFLGATARSADMNVSVSGGTASTQFLVGGSYHHEGYIFPGGFSDGKMSVNTNMHHNSTDKHVTIDFSANYSYDKNNSANGIIPLRSAFVLPPDYPPLTNPDGSINWNYNGVNLGTGNSTNPLIYLRQPYLIQSNSLLSHLEIGYKILSDLTLKSSFGYSLFNTIEHSETPKTAINPASTVLGSANFGNNDFKTWIIEPQMEYKKRIGGGKINFLLGSTFQKNVNSATRITGSNYTNDALLGSINAAGAIGSYNSSFNEYKYSAVFARLNYILQSRYIINVAGRRDGSSRFGPGKQFGTFGSLGVGWLFSEVRLVKNKFPFLSYGKLRASYGTSGNDNIGNYQYLANWAATGASYQGSTGYVPQNLFNSDYSWALNRKLEIGLECGINKDRFLANLSWYRNRCDNQLISYQLPAQTGFGSVVKNFPGLVQNKGWEIELSSINVRSKDFTWTTAFNLTVPENKLLSFPGFSTSSYANTYVLGQSLSIIRGFNFIGVNDTTGRYQFLTSKGVPTYSPSYTTDLQPIANLDPKFYGNLSNSFSYKGIQLLINLQFTRKKGINYLGQLGSGFTPGFPNNNQPVALLDRWRNMGDRSGIQQFTATSGATSVASGYFATSSGAYTDASFIRVRTMSLSYNLPDRLLNKIRMQSFRLFINGQNLFLITKYEGNDPESLFFYGVPPLRTFVAGIHLTI